MSNLRRIMTARWLIAATTRGDAFGMSVGLSMLALTRSLDYVSHVEDPDYYTVIESVIPWPWLGVLFALGGLTLLMGCAGRRHFMVFLGHAILLVANIAIFSGGAWHTLASPSHLEELSRTALVGLPLALHVLIMLRMGVTPLTQHDVIASESIVTPARFGR